jgi:hypothetical protein
MESLRATAEGMQHFKALSFKLETEKKQLQLQLDDQSDSLSEKVQVKSCYLNMLYIQLSVFCSQSISIYLLFDCQTFAGRIRELQVKLSKKQHECEVLLSNERTLQRDLEQLKMDNKGMVQLMGSMEKKIAEFASREDRTDKV